MRKLKKYGVLHNNSHLLKVDHLPDTRVSTCIHPTTNSAWDSCTPSALQMKTLRPQEDMGQLKATQPRTNHTFSFKSQYCFYLLSLAPLIHELYYPGEFSSPVFCWGTWHLSRGTRGNSGVGALLLESIWRGPKAQELMGQVDSPMWTRVFRYKQDASFLCRF